MIKPLRVTSQRKNPKRLTNTKTKETNISNVGSPNKNEINSVVFKYADSIELYTEAIFCKIPDEMKAVYYCNRSLANLRAENTSIVLNDACECIRLDPKNVKGYYRKGQAYVALRMMKEAVGQFKTV